MSKEVCTMSRIRLANSNSNINVTNFHFHLEANADSKCKSMVLEAINAQHDNALLGQ